MRKSTRIQNRFLAAILALMIIIAMVPVNVISASAATEKYPDDFTITVKDSKGKAVDEATVKYSVKINGTEELSETVTTDKGIAVVKDIDTIYTTDSETVITLSATVSKIGYEDERVVDEVITEVNDNIDVILTEKDLVNISILVKDNADDSPINDASVSISGYTSVSGTTTNGVFKTNLYKDETYSISVTKKGYRASSKSSLLFSDNSNYDVSLEAKLIDDTFKFADESPVTITYGDSYTNLASCSNSSGLIEYSVAGDSVSVNATTGEITTKKAGTSTVKAKLKEDDNYQESEITYQITVTTATDNGFGFGDPNPANIKYVEGGTYTNVASGGKGTGKVTYAITSGNAAEINENTGELKLLKAGTIEVTATRASDGNYKEISVSYYLTIEKAKQDDFKFENLSPEDQFITNNIYTNKAVGGSGKGKITYSVIEGGEYAEIKDASSPVVTLTKVGGPVIIKATKAEDDSYEEASAEYTFYIKKSPQNEMKFETTVKTIVYSPNLTYSNPLSGGSGTGATTYKIVLGDAATIDENTGVLTILKASDENGVVVIATKAGDDKYEEQTAEFTLIINKAEQTGFEFTDGNTVDKTWSADNNTYLNVLTGGQSTGEVTYSVVGTISEMLYGGPCASLNESTGEVTMHGKGAITVKAVKAGDDCYEPIETQYTLIIKRAEQSDFAFDPSVPTNLTYNDNDNQFDLATVGGNGAGAVTYSVESGDAVSINNNKVTVLKAGKVTIKAVKADTNTYEAAFATIDITINKADQYIVFDDTNTTSIIYGNKFANAAREVENTDVPDGKGYALLTKITYSVVKGENIVSVDSDGKLSFKNNATGEVIIKAEKKGDDCYKDTSATYTLNVVFVSVPDKAYSLSGEKLNDSGWYSGDVTITPAPGYEISDSNALTDNTWADRLVVSNEGYNETVIYLKNEEGISDEIVIPGEDIRIDKSAPVNLKISYSVSVMDAFFESATFGFYQASVTVTIEATDDISHIASFDYTYGDINGSIASSDITYSDDRKIATASFTIPAQFRGKVSFTAIDTAGNTADKHDDKVIIVDDIAPGLTVSFDNNDAMNSDYYLADRLATIRIEEANFFAEAFDKVNNVAAVPESVLDEHLKITVKKILNDNSENTTVYKNDNLTTPFSETSEGVWNATLLFDEDADYTFTIEYTDFSGNSAGKYETKFTIDKIQPIIDISYDNNDAENTNYYKANRTATITVVEHNFRASDIVVDYLTAKDVQGNAVDIAKDYQTLLRATEKWESDGDTHTISIPYDVDAGYEFKITYSDLAGNEQVELVSDEFTVDEVAPNNLLVSYSTSVFDAFLKSATFGFYDAPVTVTITADDITSGVDYFTYSYGVQLGASTVTQGQGDTIIPTKEIDYSNDGKTASATFTIPAEFRGSISFVATDKAGNTSDALNDKKVIIVDDVAPGITVSYDPVEATNDTYFNTDRTATITINEANFFEEAFEKVENLNFESSEWIDEHLVISVTTVDNENVSRTKFIKSADLTTQFTETEDGVWEATLLFNENADYTWSIEYTDFSGNAAETFTDAFTIDKINPVMSIEYNNDEVLNKDHYKDNRTATVTIVEHNFRPSDIVVESFTAKDIQGNDVDCGKDYQQLLREGKWERNGNTNTLEIPFDVDARYAFKFSYSDLANTGTAYIEDEFCIDKLAPATDSLKVSYSTSILDTILETITFGFYNAPVTVTIEADDTTSGVDYLTYSYKVSDGESKTNKGESDIVIATDKINYTDKGKHATAQFVIDAQFRGKVSFTATDRSGNTSEIFEDGKVIVIDNVAPGVTVTYDNNSAENGTYYNKARTATIKIKEANFFKESFEKVEDISVTPSRLIDEHLIITVNKEFNDGTSVSTSIKSDDLTTEFTKSEREEDTWIATLRFDEDADYSWSIEYKDFSGSSAGKFEDAFTVDNIDPVIEVTHSNNDAKNNMYFKADRPVTIAITEHNFKAEDVTVKVSAEKATGEITDYAKYLTNPANWTTSGNVHTANIVFNQEAYYTFDISYVDMAGRSNQSVGYGESVAPEDFVIDKTAPTKADITINNESILAKNGVAFEKFYNSTVEVKYTVNCDISGLDNISYQKVDSVSAYSENATWKAFNDSVQVKPNEKFVIYFKAEDKAGNITIVNSTGIVVDNKAPEGETFAPEIDIVPETANDNGLHNSNVKVSLKVVDPKFVGSDKNANGYYSGLKKITYRIYTKDTNATEEGTLLNIDSGVISGAKYDSDDLIKEWTSNITVSAQKFNSNKVVVEVYAIDNAGNERVTTNEMINKPIRIDVTAPSISVSYQDGSDNGDDTFSNSTNGAYFKNNRTATIVITERNFNEADVKITATKNGERFTPTLSGWRTENGSGNGDVTTHTATITYSSDGIYTFQISYTDKAGNENSTVNYSGLSPRMFTVDKTAPVFSVSYDNNSAQNGNYYKAQRIATLTIEEHNFENSRVNISLAATDNGRAVTAPGVSGWTSNGDVHTATITYSDDALYSFDIEYNDKAGNPLSEDFAQDRFYVDKTAPKVSISEIVDESANNDKGNIGYVITATDTNFDVFTPSLTAVVRDGISFKTKQFDAGSVSNITNGKTYTVTNLDDDGVYRISCIVVDKAGNAYTDVTLSHEDGSTYTEKRAGEDTLLTFSVNREGSTYDIDNSTISLIEHYYVQNVEEDVVIDEINVDVLGDTQVVTLNDKELDNSQYTVKHTGSESSWEKYTYTIDKSLFENEGEYNIVVSSKDKATNNSFSDLKDASITFVVDRTEPEVTLNGLANDGRYQTENQTVKVTPSDHGGALKSIAITLVSQDGKTDKDLLSLSDEAFEKALEEGNGTLTFDIPEGLYQDVRIACDDKAYYGENSEDNIIYDKTFTNVSVTPSAFLIFWANKPLRYAVIGGIAFVVAGIILLIFLKKRKKKEE